MRGATPESDRAQRAVSRPVDCRACEFAGTGIFGSARETAIGGPRARDRARPVDRAHGAYPLSLRRWLGVFATESRGAHLVRRRGAADSSRRAAGFQSAGRLLRT